MTQEQPFAPASTTAIARKRPPKTRLDRLLGRPESGVVIAAVLVYLFFALVAPHFFSERVTANILLASSALGIVAVGVATLMIAGQFDLSVGSVYGLSAAIVILLVNQGVPAWVALPIIMLFGLAVGTINGLLVTRLEIHSLIITLGGLMFYRGVLLAITQGFPIRLKSPDAFLSSMDFSIWIIPGPFFWFLGLVVLFAYLLSRTRFGNWLFATGGSPDAARGMGVPAERVQITAFALTSLLACLAGFISVARFSSVDALRGTGMELEVVLAVVVGGASLNGGYGSIIGAFLGVLIIGMIQQGLILIGINVYWYQAGIGLLLIVAAIVNQRVRKRSTS
ncbi:ABC transporter permease [Mesorhizobium sp. B4-1-4]|uniref:ABC transporter permease n=1 Tax=Mesorhizobium sp. B4-1-4 TaxID=2589888 RepID=UPI0015E421CD|nr:ABC transporter permease [Mesorhizobium sp. B4-1-4]UCI32083.1 ABC transporter permease [Mesorhizobium sp. B4-1-4]